ncbi:MAG: DUF2924 domain-containing protein [Rhizobiaceae bacterium]|nr:DUF2924 domain-containing protein [Rhizobiaceae bacterium]
MRARPDLAAGVAAFGKLPREDLVSHWVRIYRHQPPTGIRRELLLRAAAWHLQAKHPGGHSAEMRRLLRSAMDRVEAKTLAHGKERSRTGSEHNAGLSASIDVGESPVAEAPRCSGCDDRASQPGSPDGAMEKKAGHRRRQRRSVQPGARLLRDWNGRTHVVDLIEGS